MPESAVEVSNSPLTLGQIVLSVTTALLCAAVLWVFSSVQQHGVQLARIEAAGHPVTTQDARGLTRTLTEIQKSLARLEEHHDIARNQ